MNNELENEKHYSRQEVARILSVNPMTIYRLIIAGKIKAFKVGNDYRISETALRDYIKKTEVKGGKKNV